MNYSIEHDNPSRGNLWQSWKGFIVIALSLHAIAACGRSAKPPFSNESVSKPVESSTDGEDFCTTDVGVRVDFDERCGRLATRSACLDREVVSSCRKYAQSLEKGCEQSMAEFGSDCARRITAFEDMAQVLEVKKRECSGENADDDQRCRDIEIRVYQAQIAIGAQLDPPDTNLPEGSSF